MNLLDRINAFTQLGERLQSLTADEKQLLFDRAKIENPWFIANNIALALDGISLLLAKDALTKWTSNYSLVNINSKKVGVAMAGNIPLVGFHDLLSVLIAGHTLYAKISHQDTIILTYVINLLKKIEPKFNDRIEVKERLNNVDAVVATGSDNTSRYFEYYFRIIPHIIRKNRTSCGVILGEEPTEELAKLGKDIYSYFGLGCRNVSKLYIPEGYDLSPLITAFEKYSTVSQHHKYMNNYDYQKAILIINSIPFYDSGFSLLREETSLVSPLSVVYYEYYKDQNDLKHKIEQQENKLQCVASAKGWFSESVAFGTTQTPELTDYADEIDTMKFLSSI